MNITKLPTYGEVDFGDGRLSLFVINVSRFGIICPTEISVFGSLPNISINYNYLTNNYSWDHPNAVEISRNDFFMKVKRLKKKFKVTFKVKMKAITKEDIQDEN